jgi:hypothetical protein
MAQTPGVTLFPDWLKRAVELGYSPIELARVLGTTPATVAQLRTFTDNALQPITGFDRDTQRMLRMWQKLDAPRREAVLLVMNDMARGRAARRPARRKPKPR